MSDRCAFRLENGKFCRCWPLKGTLHCHNHTPTRRPAEPQDADENLSPLDRLNTHDDLFDVVRETLNAIRLGRVSPGRAYATGYFIDLWMRVRERMEKAGPETKKFQKRRRLSDAVEQATFDMVAEKVVHVMTGKTIDEIEEQYNGQVTAPGEPHWTERPFPPQRYGSKAMRETPAPSPSAPPTEAAQQDSTQRSSLPKNWGYEKEEKS